MSGDSRKRPVTEIDFTTAEFPTLYAQEVVVGSSFYDFSLVFIQSSIRGKQPVTSVTLPPAVAKQLAGLLTANVARYEENFGEIKIPGTAVVPAGGYEGGLS